MKFSKTLLLSLIRDDYSGDFPLEIVMETVVNNHKGVETNEMIFKHLELEPGKLYRIRYETSEYDGTRNALQYEPEYIDCEEVFETKVQITKYLSTCQIEFCKDLATTPRPPSSSRPLRPMIHLKQAYSLTNWDLKYLGLAYYISQWSKDPTTKVGCVISNIHDICIGMGFNGGPKGTIDSEETLMDKERKRLRTVHAEMNAIHFSTGNIRGSTFYTTHTPCCSCAANIIQRDPRRVISLTGPTGLGVDWGRSTEEASLLFKEAGIDLVIVNNNDLAKLEFQL